MNPPHSRPPPTMPSRRVAATRELIVANSMLEAALSTLYAKASHGFLRGRRVKPKAEGPQTAGNLT
jgi:hypothetical protein